MLNRFTSPLHACLLIIAMLCLNCLLSSVRAALPLSDSAHKLSLDLRQSQSGQNKQGQQGQQGQQRQQDQPIRVKTELINLRAVVTNKQGQPVTDLKQEDFELIENGKPQEVSFFSVVKIPGRGEARQAEKSPANAATDIPAGAARPADAIGRTVLLYVDTLHLAASSLLSVKQALRKFIDERLTDQDLTAIVTSAGSLGVVEQFTRDRNVLRRAVARLGPRPNASDTLLNPYIAAMVDRGDRDALAVARSIYVAEEHANPNDPGITQMVQMKARQVLTEATYMRRATLITLKEVVQRLSDLPGQRLLVMVSDGFTLFDSGGSQDTNDLQAVTSRAVRSGVVIYSIDAKGLQPPALFDASISAMPQDPRINSYVSAGERDLENGLNALAKDTGGEAFFNTNDTAGAIGRALDDNQLYYTLAYYPALEESDKKFRKITIKIKNHPDYNVRAQRGYLPADLAKKTKEEEAKTPQQRFVDAILAPLPLTDIGVIATPSFVEVPQDASQVSLQLHIDGGTLTYREGNGKYTFDAELLTMIYNSEGKRVDLKSETVSGTLTPERLEVAKQNGFQYNRRLQLKPGLYQIRVGVTERTNERTGTAAAWIDIPDLSKKNKMALSSLFVSDPRSMGFQEADSNNGQSAEPQSPKTIQGVRYYKPGQQIVYFFRLYNMANDRSENDAVMQIEIMQDEKAVITIPWQPVSTRLFGKDVKGLVVGGLFALQKVQPGVYDLRVSVKDSKMKKPVQCSVAFGIE
jgi:VWFA-related protein